ncbi:hypothetical protein ABZW30_42420 [Kitasatospora sp. NPDC004669]|uniref:hypothetical protein n=1 Tax=Kitasatospora sp. NPDC004669 TaxID=3154555 RepID=UPI0033AF4A43
MSEPTPGNALFVAERIRRDWHTQEDFATAYRAHALAIGEPVDISVRQVRRWESDHPGWPRRDARRVLSSMFGGIDLTELGFVRPATRRRPAAPHQEQEEDVKRRSLFLLGAGALATTVLAPDRITPTHVRSLHDAEQTLYNADLRHGSAQLRSQAAHALNAAHNWLQTGSYTEETGRQLHIATGELSVAAGWLAHDSGLPGKARSLYTEALASARMARDLGLEAHAFGCMSLLAHATGHPREAVSAAQAAHQAAGPLGSPRWLSLLHMREARGWALQGDRAATDRAVVRAHHLYAQGPADGDPTWIDFYTPGELAGLESLCRADLGQYERAAAGAEQAVLLTADSHARNGALYTVDIALHHLNRTRPDPEAAADAGHRALAYLPEVQSQRLQRALRDLASAIAPHRARASTDWLDAYQAATAG